MVISIRPKGFITPYDLNCNQRHFIAWFASFYIIKHVFSHAKTRQITRQTASNHFTLYYQLHHLPQLTLKQRPPFQRVTTPLSLRRTIGRCSWSLRNEESKGLGVRLCLPNIISPLIINKAMLTIVSSRNCIGIALLSQWMNFAILMSSWGNSVRVVLLIARGWRGTSLPRVNVRKEIQRHRCWAFSVKARL